MIPVLLTVERALKNAQQLKRYEKIGAIESLKWSFLKIGCSYKQLKPFNLFERAICGLLAVKSDLSMPQIAQLLGFDAQDVAACQLVKTQIGLLQKRGLIYSGDLSACALTPQGVKCAKIGGYPDKKVALDVYFDPLTPQKWDVHAVFSKLKSNLIPGLVQIPDLSETNWTDLMMIQKGMNIIEKVDFERETYCKMDAEVLLCEVQHTYCKSKRMLVIDSQSFKVIPHCNEIWNRQHTAIVRHLIPLLQRKRV